MEGRMNNILERLPTAAIAFPLEAGSTANESAQNPQSPLGGIAGDAINLMRRPGMTDVMTGGAMGIVSQLIDIIKQLLLSFGQNQNFFSSATASSTGDPHLAFDGTDAAGANRQSHFDSMTAHRDLLDSASFAGGYKISTAVTQPAANGVTYNREATISSNFGRTRVSLDNAGNVKILSNGRAVSIAQGQTIDLGNGESVTRNADGSLAVTEQNGMGGSITTHLSENGSGVDVNVQAQNVTLAGDLVPATSLRR
jgi:hypothetical protein